MNSQTLGQSLLLWLRRLLYLTTAAVGLVTLLGFLGRVFWVFDLIGNYRSQCFGALLLSTILLLVLRNWKEAAAAALLAGVNLALLLPFYLPLQESNEVVTSHTAVLVNLLRRNDRIDLVEAFLRETDPDLVVFLEVTPAWEIALKQLEPLLPYSFVVAKDGYTGISVSSREPFSSIEFHSLGFQDWPSVVAQIELEGQLLTFIGAHPAPPVGPIAIRFRNEHLTELARITAAQSGPLILLGDLNTTSWSPSFHDLVTTTGLLESRFGFGVQPSYPVGSVLWKVPIDHVLHSPEIIVVDRQLGPELGSDHYPVVIEFFVSESN